MRKKFKIAKIDSLFAKKINDTAIERVKKGLDKSLTREQASIRRFTRAMTRYEPLWELLKSAEFKEDFK